MAKLTAKQEMFVQEYMIDLNATQAAIRAGYSTKGANTTACKTLANGKVRARVDELMAERARRTGINADRVLRELARLALVNAPDVVKFDDATVREDAARDDTAAIASVKVRRKDGEDFSEIEREVKLCDKVKALELLGKHMGMFTDRLNITAQVAPQIVDDIPRGGDDGH